MAVRGGGDLAASWLAWSLAGDDDEDAEVALRVICLDVVVRCLMVDWMGLFGFRLDSVIGPVCWAQAIRPIGP